MKIGTNNQTELTLEAILIPGLEAATETWYVARHRFQSWPGADTLTMYNAATDTLQLAFEQGHSEEPWGAAAFERFRLRLIEREPD